MTKRLAFVLFPTASIRRTKYTAAVRRFRALGFIFAGVPLLIEPLRASLAFRKRRSAEEDNRATIPWCQQKTSPLA